MEQGEPQASEKLLELVYEELRRLAASKMARETPGQTLQATELVHEAWLRLVGAQNPKFENRAHFFAAAAEAMRRILIDRARRKLTERHGGGFERGGRSRRGPGTVGGPRGAGQIRPGISGTSPSGQIALFCWDDE